jgi:hypothetical protein
MLSKLVIARHILLFTQTRYGGVIKLPLRTLFVLLLAAMTCFEIKVHYHLSAKTQLSYSYRFSSCIIDAVVVSWRRYSCLYSLIREQKIVSDIHLLPAWPAIINPSIPSSGCALVIHFPRRQRHPCMALCLFTELAAAPHVHLQNQYSQPIRILTWFTLPSYGGSG